MLVVFARLIDLCLSFDDQASPLIVPLELDLVSLEEVLLGNGGIEIGNIENLDGTWLTLILHVNFFQEYERYSAPSLQVQRLQFDSRYLGRLQNLSPPRPGVCSRPARDSHSRRIESRW